MALALDLTLQGAGIGGDPDAGAIGLGPERGRGQISQRLARPRSRLGQHHLGLATPRAGLEGMGRLSGEISLERSGLQKAGPLQELGQAGAGGVRVHGRRTRLPGRRLILPFLQAAPGVKAIAAPGTADGPAQAQGA